MEEAIGVYMLYDKTEATSLELYDVERTLWVPKRKIQTSYTEFVEKDNITFYDTEKIHLLIKWENRDEIENLGLRIEIWNDSNVTQASYMLYDFYSGHAGEFCSVELALDISALKDASYKMVYVFFEKDEYGNSKDLDIVFGLRFEKTAADNSSPMIWNLQRWGYVELPSPIVLSISTINSWSTDAL